MLSAFPVMPVSSLGLRVQGPPDDPLGDHEETVEAGEAFYMTPGHAPAARRAPVRPVQPGRANGATTKAIKTAMAQNA